MTKRALERRVLKAALAMRDRQGWVYKMKKVGPINLAVVNQTKAYRLENALARLAAHERKRKKLG